MTELEGTPRPHYLTSVKNISADGTQLKGWVTFPSTDPTIGDRVDHVNVAHHLFAVWNAARLMCQKAGFRSPRAYETTTVSRQPTQPDTQVSIDATALIVKETPKRIFGTISSTFRGGRKILCKVSAKFVAQRVVSA